jgi:mannose-6-phosphate isomerase-like protein (cupin superfamily)
MLRRFVLSLSFIAAQPLIGQPAQTTEPTAHTTADLQQREAKLIETANKTPTGFAVATLDDYGNDYTLLVVRSHTGDAERHQFFADEIVITKGTITLVTGGAMQGEHPNNGPGRPGETLGSSIQGGKEVVLHAGDIVHIPAGIPHWVKVPLGTTTTYLVFKEK